MDRVDHLPLAAIRRQNRVLGAIAVAGPLLAAALAGSVMLAWLSHAPALAARLPLLFDMKFNGALATLAIALGFWLHLQHHARAARLLAGLGTLIALAAFGAVTLGVPPGFAQLLLHDWVDASPSGGAVPAVAALAMVALGMAVLALELLRASQARNFAVQLVCLLCLALALEVIIARSVASRSIFENAVTARVSIVGAVAAVALCAGMLAAGWRAETASVARMPLWLPLLYCLAVALLDLYTPLELNIGIFYILLVTFALAFDRPSAVIDLAVFATIFILLGMVLSPRGSIPMWMVVFNRLLAVAAVWVMAVVINALLEARNRARRSQAHLAAAQRIANSGSFELNFRTMALHGSHAFDAMHARRVRGGSWASFVTGTVAPDDRPALIALIENARNGILPGALDYSFLGPDRKARNAVLHTQLLTGNGGAITGLIGVAQDVTAAREAAAQQADIDAQLRHAQKLEALGELAGGIAHDLNNTLLPVTMLVPALLKSAQGRAREGLEIIGGAAERARELVREVLMFSRKGPAANAPLQLDALVRQALPIIRAGIPATVRLDAQLQAVPDILGNKGQLYQTLLNLVTNAARAIGSKPGTVTIAVSRDDDDSVRLTVSDDGIGMDAATRQRIFEPFFTSRADAGGTGLGLAIVNGIVKAHGGSIAVASTPGAGTRFDLVFPPLRELAPA